MTIALLIAAPSLISLIAGLALCRTAQRGDELHRRTTAADSRAGGCNDVEANNDAHADRTRQHGVTIITNNTHGEPRTGQTR